MGGSRQLAQDYLAAELGPGPRHSCVAAAYFAAAVPLVQVTLISAARRGRRRRRRPG
ncbi:hypothetical protein [Streptomyces sp. NPDC093261]|uniref:hypothetical protein n=1 Tax=Streptomyces sp. NPDC093261 TaxID=3366037 RepID=UPI00380B6F4E